MKINNTTEKIIGEKINSNSSLNFWVFMNPIQTKKMMVKKNKKLIKYPIK